MPFFNLARIKQHKTQAAAYILTLVIFLALIVYFWDALHQIFTSPESVRSWVLGYGKWAPVAMFVLQMAQVVIAPLNNFLINFVGGYIFGPWYGFLLNYTGWLAGAILVFWLSRWAGIPFVRLFFSEDKIKKFNDIVSRGQYLIFLLFLLPGPPDDFLVYIIGLSSSFKFRTFLWMVAISKIPGKLATSFLGADTANLNTSWFSIAIYAAFLIPSAIIVWKKPELWKMWKE